jgi:hypothetical protein
LTRRSISDCAATFGRILNGAFDEHRIAGGIAHIPGVLGDPDALAGPVPVDFRDEVLDAAFGFQEPLEFLAAAGNHIPVERRGLDRRDVLGLAAVAVHGGHRPD